MNLSHQRVRAAQFLTVLGDKIRTRKAGRVFLDGVTHVLDESTRPSELEQLLYKLAVQFKLLDVTSLLTVESKALHFGGEITERGFSPVADNLLMLRYILRDGELCPALRVVKTRGTVHERGTYAFSLGKGGIRVLGRALDSDAVPEKRRKMGPAARGSPPARRGRPR